MSSAYRLKSARLAQNSNDKSQPQRNATRAKDNLEQGSAVCADLPFPPAYSSRVYLLSAMLKLKEVVYDDSRAQRGHHALPNPIRRRPKMRDRGEATTAESSRKADGRLELLNAMQ